jgi:hypothetical protein
LSRWSILAKNLYRVLNAYIADVYALARDKAGNLLRVAITKRTVEIFLHVCVNYAVRSKILSTRP